MTCSHLLEAYPVDGRAQILQLVRSSHACAVGTTVTAFMAANTTETVETYCSERGSYCLCLVEPPACS
jgi:hypothetical protein